MSKVTMRGAMGADNARALSAQEQLAARLRSLSYPALCLAAARTLARCGYVSVHPVGRLHVPQGNGHDLPFQANRPFGANRFNALHGGFDLIALSRTDLVTSLTLVQIKQYAGPVPRRFVDELRSAMERLGAEQGLIITTSHFSELARDVAAGSRLLPVRLVDGKEWVCLLTERGLGLSRNADGRSAFDADFFNGLERHAAGGITGGGD